MTGFGRSEIINEDRKIVVEIKAVNHRYCDMNVKLPKKLNYFETTIRTYRITKWNMNKKTFKKSFYINSKSISLIFQYH